MNIRAQVKQNLLTIRNTSLKDAQSYGQKLLQRLDGNLKSGQTAKDNAGLILKYQNVQPRGYTAMQQAFANAVS